MLVMCQELRCHARGGCLRYRARPALEQVYGPFGRTRINGAACPSVVPISPKDKWDGRVRGVNEADHDVMKAENAKQINPTEEQV